MSPEDPQTIAPAADYFSGDPRKDGWTPEREAGFIGHLADSGLVAAACRAVEMGVSGAYALRRRADGLAFSLGWGAALRLARQRLMDMMMARAIEGDEIVTVRDGDTTTRRLCNPKIAFGMLDRLGESPGTSLISVITHDFDAFLAIIAKGGRHADVRAYFTARIGDRATLEILLSTLPLVDESAINDGSDGDLFDQLCLLESKGEICCNFPPPPGFDGRQEGAFGDETYCRTLTPTEKAAVETFSESADSEDSAGKSTKNGKPAPDPAYLAKAIAARDLYFGFVPGESAAMAQT